MCGQTVNHFLVIYNSTVPEGTGEGVYLQCKVRELTDEGEVIAAKQVCDSRVGKAKDRDFTKYSGDAPLRGYQATPIKVWMNSDEEEDIDYITITSYTTDKHKEAVMANVRKTSK